MLPAWRDMVLSAYPCLLSVWLLPQNFFPSVFMPVFKWPTVLFSGHCRGHLPGLSDFLSSFLSVFPKLSCFHFCLHFWWLPILQREMLTFLNTAWNSFLICHNLLLQCCVLPFCGWWLPSCPRHVAHGPVPRSSLCVWLCTLECSCLCGTLQNCICPVHMLSSPQGFRAFCCCGWSFASLQGPFWSPRIPRVF